MRQCGKEGSVGGRYSPKKNTLNKCASAARKLNTPKGKKNKDGELGERL
jgi:hypothetical protein